jgi:hypothetical protein
VSGGSAPARMTPRWRRSSASNRGASALSCDSSAQRWQRLPVDRRTLAANDAQFARTQVRETAAANASKEHSSSRPSSRHGHPSAAISCAHRALTDLPNSRTARAERPHMERRRKWESVWGLGGEGAGEIGVLPLPMHANDIAAAHVRVRRGRATCGGAPCSALIGARASAYRW